MNVPVTDSTIEANEENERGHEDREESNRTAFTKVCDLTEKEIIRGQRITIFADLSDIYITCICFERDKTSKPRLQSRQTEEGMREK